MLKEKKREKKENYLHSQNYTINNNNIKTVP